MKELPKLFVEMKLEVRSHLKLKIYWEYRNLQSDQFGKKNLNMVELNKAKRSGRPSEISQRDQNWLVRQTKKMNRGRVLSDITNKFNRSRDENGHIHPRKVQNTKIFTWTRRKATSSEKKMLSQQINRKNMFRGVLREEKSLLICNGTHLSFPMKVR